MKPLKVVVNNLIKPMSGTESSKNVGKRSKKQQMAVEAAAIASLLQQNRDVRISEPSRNSQDAPETCEVMNCQNSNTKDKGKEKCKGNDKGKMQQMHTEAAVIASLLEKNRGVCNSEPPMDSQDALDTDEAINSQNSNSKGKCKGNGKGNGKRKGKTNGPKTVTFNRLGQPVGAYAAPLAHFLSKAAKCLVPLTVPSWFGDGLSAEHKDLIWNHVKKYYIIDDCHRKFCFQKMAKYWRGYESDMIKRFKEGVKSASVEVVARNTRPANVHSLDVWTKFIKYCLSPNQVKESSENPDEITRVDVWLAGFSRKKKDGDEEVEEQEVVRQVKEKLAQQPDSSQGTINDDPITQVLGPERRGRVRGYGFGATSSLLIGRGLADSRINMMEKELQDLKMLVKDLLSQRDKGDNSSENNNVEIPSIHVVNSKKDTSFCQKRKNVPCAMNSPKQVKKKALQTQKLHLLSLYETGKIVAIGELASKDPDDKVHCIRLGPHCWKVWVREVIEDIPLSRPTEEFSTLSEAIGSTVAWPFNCIKLL